MCFFICKLQSKVCAPISFTIPPFFQPTEPAALYIYKGHHVGLVSFLLSAWLLPILIPVRWFQINNIWASSQKGSKNNPTTRLETKFKCYVYIRTYYSQVFLLLFVPFSSKICFLTRMATSRLPTSACARRTSPSETRLRLFAERRNISRRK